MMNPAARACLFLLALSAFLLPGTAEISIAGRGHRIDVSTWKSIAGEISGHRSWVPDGEVFCAARDGETGTLYLGGTYRDRGIVWEITGPDTEPVEHVLEGGRTVYDLQMADGLLIAGGVHYFAGGVVWTKGKGKEFDRGSVLDRSSLVYAVCGGANGRIFAGGIGGSGGRVWIYNQGEWDKGHSLHQSREITTLVPAGDQVYAAGVGIGPQNSGVGAYWIHDGQSWKVGQTLKYSRTVYAGTRSKDGVITFVGSGEDGKVLWENSKGFWNAVSLQEGLALYAIATHPLENRLVAGGWNFGRSGRLWIAGDGTTWDEGRNVEGCFIVRGLAFH